MEKRILIVDLKTPRQSGAVPINNSGDPGCK
jgi:hypothetical protein